MPNNDDTLDTILPLLPKIYAVRKEKNPLDKEEHALSARIKEWMLDSDKSELDDPETSHFAYLSPRLSPFYEVDRMPFELVVKLWERGLLQIQGDIPLELEGQLNQYKKYHYSFMLKVENFSDKPVHKNPLNSE